ncbi:hypothetical protein [Metasolibacillus sp.]|uniref:hypothetical protein n=1 Tax=Metasolibacillus sp. TaxID=2703680 RepID=UPI0025EEA619|nr:hypothetical protein [Metasolibacillus sp.]MCT6924592.1 hypothetical protein [Metasolibacillus sp.]MCT6940794.1 hypothetical protein [Metasolibacillus sp.]
MVLYILAQIWKFGGVIERDESDGQLELKNHQKIPSEVLKAAEPIFDEIDAYLKSVEGMNATDMTAWKMIVALAGWQRNESIGNFLNSDEVALNLFMDYQAKLAVNGWGELYEDWRKYENAETEQLKKQIYERAILHARQNK